MKWVEPDIYQPNSEILEAFSDTLLLGGLLARRAITSVEQARAFLNLQAYTPASPFDFPDCEQAVSRVMRAIQERELIGIWGDFDADGQTSTALLIEALRASGARTAYHIPVRASESHGIQLEYLKKFIDRDISLLITCDTGITEFESLNYLSEIGLDVILTDHHTPADRLPPALAVINPRLLPSGHAMSGLAGVGAAYQLLHGLFLKLGRENDLKRYHDLLALGTIADLAELTGDNRYYARLGLEQMNQNPRPALRAMLALAGFKNQRVNESHVGFTLAPRLNASGRLEDANPMVEFLISTDEASIEKTARHLESLNARRKQAVDMVYQSALEILTQQPALNQYPVIVLAKSGWESGVVGIAASRLVEKFGKPALLMNVRDEIAAGSARSVEGINIIQAIRENAELLLRHGGHPMAAGMSLSVNHIAQFREALSVSIDAQTAGRPVEPTLEIDAYLPLSGLSAPLLDEIDQLAPFGPGNPPPLLVSRGLEIDKYNLIGKTREHRKLTLKDQQGNQAEALWWNSADRPLPDGLFNLAFYARRDSFKGANQTTLEWVDFQKGERETIDLPQGKIKIRIEDHRNNPQALNNLNSLSENPGWGSLLWGEASQIKGAISRSQLIKADRLAILTPPPSMREIQQAMELVCPKKVYLFALPGPQDSAEFLLNLVSRALREPARPGDASIELEALAGQLGQTRETVLAALRVWQSHGDIEYHLEEGQVRFELTNHPQSTDLKRQLLALQELLKETRSYRNYYKRADPALLLAA